MSSQADFIEGFVKFSEIDPKPLDLKKFQAAMFLDRPDLWPPIRRKQKPSALPGQPSLFEGKPL